MNIPKQVIKSHSSFWRTTEYDDYRDPFSYDDPTEKLLILHKHRTAISRFVNIIANNGKKIPVTFMNDDNGDSFTNGESVVLSSSINEKNYDSVVGLALHEGSHILLTDFDYLKSNLDNMSKVYLMDDENSVQLLIKSLRFDVDRKTIDKICESHTMIETFKNITNVIEDRRIDKYIRQTAPGYRVYYFELYKRYFTSRDVDKYLLSDESKVETWDGYMNRLINIMNNNVKRDDLVRMGDIIDLVDLTNISRIKSTQETFELSVKIFEIIAEAVEDATSKQEDEPKEHEQQDKTTYDDNDNTTNGDNDLSNGTGNTQSQFSDNQLGRINKALEKQRDFISGNIKKSKVGKSNIKKLEALEGSELEDTKLDIDGCTIKSTIIKYPTIQALSVMIPEITSSYQYNNPYNDYIEALNRGRNLGSRLAKKIQIKDEKRDLVYNRQKRGKLDRRMLHEAGTGSSNIFNRVLDASKTPVNLHFSLDLSSSMGGSNWIETLQLMAMFVRAADKVKSLNISIDLRYSGWTNRSNVYSIYAYNSKLHKSNKFFELFKWLSPSGVTPESINYECLLTEYNKTYEPNSDNIFITVSDGGPNVIPGFYSNVRHCRKIIKNIKNIGYNVAAFFIGYEETYTQHFKQLYLEDSVNVSIDDVSKIGRIITNKLK